MQPYIFFQSAVPHLHLGECWLTCRCREWPGCSQKWFTGQQLCIIIFSWMKRMDEHICHLTKHRIPRLVRISGFWETAVIFIIISIPADFCSRNYDFSYFLIFPGLVPYMGGIKHGLHLAAAALVPKHDRPSADIVFTAKLHIFIQNSFGYEW